MSMMLKNGWRNNYGRRVESTRRRRFSYALSVHMRPMCRRAPPLNRRGSLPISPRVRLVILLCRGRFRWNASCQASSCACMPCFLHRRREKALFWPSVAPSGNTCHHSSQEDYTKKIKKNRDKLRKTGRNWEDLGRFFSATCCFLWIC